MVGYRLVAAVLIGLAVVSSGARAGTQAPEPCGPPPGEDARDLHSGVATSDRPAKIVAQGDASPVAEPAALRLTLRPTVVTPGSPYLVQVYAMNLCDERAEEPGRLIGAVSFFPLRAGQAQVFVLPRPEGGFPPGKAQNILLTVKLVPANPDRRLEASEVAVEGAQFVN